MTRTLKTAAFTLGLSALLCTLGTQTDAQSGAMTKVSMVLNWFPEPEAGGFYAAVKDGLYKAKGLDLTIVSGGPGVAGQALLVSNRVQFATMDSPTVLLGRDQGIPLVGIFSTFQTFPQGLMSHEEQAITSFGDLAGRTVAVSPGAAYWEYIEKKYNLAGKVQVLNYNGQLADWQRDKAKVTQNYITSEPYYAIKAGSRPKTLLIASSGFNPYGNLMTVTEDYLKNNPKTVQAFIEASQEGWKRYLASPTKYNDVMIEANKELTPEYMAYASAAEKQLIAGGDAGKYGIGYMSDARWKTILSQLSDLKLLKNTLNVKAAYSMTLFPKK